MQFINISFLKAELHLEGANVSEIVIRSCV